MIIDVHCHYTLTHRAADPSIDRFSFEPAALHDGRAALDSFVSPRAQRRLSFRAFRWMMGVDAREGVAVVDRAVERFYDTHLLSEGPVERFVLLAFDDYHDDEGRRPPPPERRHPAGADIYTSNSLVRALCRKRPDRFLFGASVHPYRRDAVDAIHEVFEAGASLLKWLPLHQNIDIADERTIAVLRACADVGLPVLVHYNEEFTLTTQHPEFQSIRPLLDVLRKLRSAGEMPPVIVAHVATPVWPLGALGSHEELLEALRGEFADAPLYADISALTVFPKIPFMRQVAKRQELHSKLLFGSDFPVPLALPRLRRDLGREYASIKADPSWPQQAARVMRHIGFNEIVFHRAAMLLPNADAFAPVTPRASG